MSTKHTPGPWRSHSAGHVYRADGIAATVVAKASDYNWAHHRAQCEADLRLIAAAPELMAACKAIKNCIPLFTSMDFYANDSLSHAVGLLDRAIAAAEGTPISP